MPLSWLGVQYGLRVFLSIGECLSRVVIFSYLDEKTAIKATHFIGSKEVIVIGIGIAFSR